MTGIDFFSTVDLARGLLPIWLVIALLSLAWQVFMYRERQYNLQKLLHARELEKRLMEKTEELESTLAKVKEARDKYPPLVAPPPSVATQGPPRPDTQRMGNPPSPPPVPRPATRSTSAPAYVCPFCGAAYLATPARCESCGAPYRSEGQKHITLYGRTRTIENPTRREEERERITAELWDVARKKQYYIDNPPPIIQHPWTHSR